ncbi:MAG: DDE-type integrase/transposase/recombinase [Nitrososphaeria archaeon]|nr:DDE-type integrase/transposase/recombinase [Nitrososphaeria archaeon]
MRRLIAVDETKFKVKGRNMFVWAAINVDARELLAVYISYQRSSLNPYVLLRKGAGQFYRQANNSSRH